MNLYKNYYKTHDYSTKEVDYKNSYLIFTKNYGNIFKNLSKDIKILEIGSGQGKFAYFCQQLGFKNYIGIDLDPDIIEITKKEFPEYKFYHISGLEFFKNKKEDFDIIFMSHVFEHLSLEEGFKLAELINKSLKKGGLRINEMPNGQSLYYGTYGRYNDITHKILYTPNSFNQILLKVSFERKNIIHKNEYIGYGIVKRIIYKIFFQLHKLWLLSIGIKILEPHTFNLISIIKKGQK